MLALSFPATKVQNLQLQFSHRKAPGFQQKMILRHLFNKYLACLVGSIRSYTSVGRYILILLSIHTFTSDTRMF